MAELLEVIDRLGVLLTELLELQLIEMSLRLLIAKLGFEFLFEVKPLLFALLVELHDDLGLSFGLFSWPRLRSGGSNLYSFRSNGSLF